MTSKLKKLKCDDLRDICRTFNIKGYSKAKKDKLIKMIVREMKLMNLRGGMRMSRAPRLEPRYGSVRSTIEGARKSQARAERELARIEGEAEGYRRMLKSQKEHEKHEKRKKAKAQQGAILREPTEPRKSLAELDSERRTDLKTARQDIKRELDYVKHELKLEQQAYSELLKSDTLEPIDKDFRIQIARGNIKRLNRKADSLRRERAKLRDVVEKAKRMAARTDVFTDVIKYPFL